MGYHLQTLFWAGRHYKPRILSAFAAVILGIFLLSGAVGEPSPSSAANAAQSSAEQAHEKAQNAQSTWNSLKKLPDAPVQVLILAAAQRGDAAMHDADTAMSGRQFDTASEKYQQAAQSYDLAAGDYAAIIQRFLPDGQSKYSQLDDKGKSASDQAACQAYHDLFAMVLAEYQQTPSPKYAKAMDAAAQGVSAIAAGKYSQAVVQFGDAEKIYQSMLHVVPDQFKTVGPAMAAADLGDIIYVKRGTYDENITFKNGVLLLGEGRDVVTLHGTASSLVLSATDCDSGVISGLSFESAGPNAGKDFSPCVDFHHSKLLFSDCIVRNAGQDGMICQVGDASLVRNCTFEKNGRDGLVVTGSGSVTRVEENLFSNNGWAGLAFMDGAKGSALKNDCHTNKICGIATLGTGTSPDISGNTCHENIYNGMSIFDGQPHVANNTCSKNGINGIGLQNQGTCTVESNTCKGNGQMGIHIDGTVCLVKNNESDGNASSGIYFGRHSGGEADNNTCQENGQYGIAVVGDQNDPVHTTHATLNGNNCFRNKLDGIDFAYGATGTAKKNTCADNVESGIEVYGEKTAPVLSDNTCTGNKQMGIIFWGAASGSADHNTCANNTQSGIQVSDKKTAAVLSTNTCTGNKQFGIAFQAGAAGSADHNICESNGKAGIGVLGADSAPTLTGNSSKNNRGWGIRVDNAKATVDATNTAEGNAGGQIQNKAP